MERPEASFMVMGWSYLCAQDPPNEHGGKGPREVVKVHLGEWAAPLSGSSNMEQDWTL